jgi:hypothetical protein
MSAAISSGIDVRAAVTVIGTSVKVGVGRGVLLKKARVAEGESGLAVAGTGEAPSACVQPTRIKDAIMRDRSFLIALLFPIKNLF